MSTEPPAASRPSKNKCQEDLAVEPDDVGEGALRRLSVRGENLRDEAREGVDVEGDLRPMYAVGQLAEGEDPKARRWYKIVTEWRQMIRDYQNSNMEYTDPDGETVRSRLLNSYLPEYGDKYYAKLMDLKRGVERQWGSDLLPIMLTFSASTLNANGQARCPGDHMREVAEGWKTARKQLYPVLSGHNWEYARIWEPTTEDGEGPAGYGHMHVAVFVEASTAEDLEAEDFAPVMRSYVRNTETAGWDAHRPDGDAVSLVEELEDANLATYISEYIGVYGDDPLERPMHEQAFLATSWATKTRRVAFSEGANEIINGEQWRRETGLRPEDRGEATGDTEGCESDESGEESEGMADVVIDPESETVEVVGDESDGESDVGEWTAEAVCQVSGEEPEYYEVSGGGVDGGPVEEAPGVDPLRELGDPPPG